MWTLSAEQLCPGQGRTRRLPPRHCQWPWRRARFGSFPRYSSAKAEKELGIQFLPLEQTITDTADRFKELGVEP